MTKRGNWIEKQKAKKALEEKDELRKENMAKYFFDLSKLSFAGLVIGVVVPLYGDIYNENNWFSIGTGIFLTTLLALSGNRILK